MCFKQRSVVAYVVGEGLPVPVHHAIGVRAEGHAARIAMPVLGALVLIRQYFLTTVLALKKFKTPARACLPILNGIENYDRSSGRMVFAVELTNGQFRTPINFGMTSRVIQFLN